MLAPTLRYAICAQSKAPIERGQPMCDDGLMERVREGDDTAFEELVRKHQRWVLQFAARCLNDTASARDVTQSVFLELYRARQRYQPRGRFVPYLRAIALNQCRAARRATLAHPHALCETTLVSMPNNDVLRRALQRALTQLSDKLRAVVILHYVEDLTLVEAAETLQLPVGTVKSRLFEALTRLRRSVVDA